MERKENVNIERGLTKMALTIDDIYDKEFALKGGGYDRDDVDRFLDEICDEMANMTERMEGLEKALKQAQMDVEIAKAAKNAAPVVVEREPVARTSETLEGILLSAQRLSDEAVENAKRKAQDIVDEARKEEAKLSSEMEAMRKGVADYKQSFLNMLEKYKKMLDADAFLAD